MTAEVAAASTVARAAISDSERRAALTAAGWLALALAAALGVATVALRRTPDQRPVPAPRRPLQTSIK